MSSITIIEGNNNDKDNTRAIMVKGEAGATISTIAKTGTSGLVDTYTITLDDGRTQTFTVTNGKSIVSITKTDTTGLVDTYTITFNDSTTQTFTVTNAYSPTATVTKTNSVATISITDKDGTTTATVSDGAPGYEVPANSVIGWDSDDTIPNGYEETTETFGGGESLPVGSEIDYDGNSVPTGWQQVDDPSVYSSTEKRIGTWIDNKPLYMQTITTTISSTGTTTISHGISNVAKIWVDNSASFLYFSSTTQLPVNFYNGNNYISCYAGASDITYNCSAFNGQPVYITVKYTKTTD